MIGIKFWLGKVAKTWRQLLVAGGTVLALGACGPGLDSLAPFSIGGTVTGLTGTVVLQNGADNLSVGANGAFTFKTELANNSAYQVTVLNQPSGQTCTVSNGAGTATANVTTVSVRCIATAVTPPPYSIGGTISGLVGTVILQNSGGDNLNLTGNGSFVFNTRLLSVGTYAVTVLTQPSGQICTVSNGNGIASTNVTTVSVLCAFPPNATKQLGVPNVNTVGTAVATDASGNVYVAGYTSGKLDTDPLIGVSDFFLTKYDSSGNYKYTKQFGATGAVTIGTSVAIDASDIVNGKVYVYVVGYTTGQLDVDPQSGTTDLFLTKYDSSTGGYKYTKQYGAAGKVTKATSVAVDSYGNVYVAGETTGRLGSDSLTGTTDCFVAMYDSIGNSVFTKQFGVAGKDTFGQAAAVDSNNNFYVGGSTYGKLGTDPFKATTGFSDFFVRKYDTSGNPVFTRQLGVAGVDTVGTSVAIDANGNVYVVGTTSGQLDIDPLIGTAGFSDFFITKYSSIGDFVSTKQFGAVTRDTYGLSVATDAADNVYVTGYTTGRLGTDPQLGTSDFFIAKYASAGAQQSIRQLGALGASTFGQSVATDKLSGNVFVAGFTTGNLDGNTLTGSTDFFLAKYNNSLVKQ